MRPDSEIIPTGLPNLVSHRDGPINTNLPHLQLRPHRPDRTRIIRHLPRVQYRIQLCPGYLSQTSNPDHQACSDFPFDGANTPLARNLVTFVSRRLSSGRRSRNASYGDIESLSPYLHNRPTRARLAIPPTTPSLLLSIPCIGNHLDHPLMHRRIRTLPLVEYHGLGRGNSQCLMPTYDRSAHTASMNLQDCILITLSMSCAQSVEKMISQHHSNTLLNKNLKAEKQT